MLAWPAYRVRSRDQLTAGEFLAELPRHGCTPASGESPRISGDYLPGVAHRTTPSATTSGASEEGHQKHMKVSTLRLLADARSAKAGGEQAMATRRQARLAELVAWARTHSPYYRHLYRGLPTDVSDLALLPVTDKPRLMAVFDDWVTDPAVTLAQARAFADDPARIGEPFAGRYTLTTTSGTTGTHGIFLQDARAGAVTSAMMARMLAGWLTMRDVARIARRGARMALVAPAGGHFASTVAAARLSGRSRIATFSVHQPLDDLVAELNAFRPAVLAPYASIGVLLAGEAEAGRLHIDPTLVMLSAEGLPTPEYARIAAALGAKVRTSYACNECPFLSYGCSEGWMHLNADWAILEPVDEQHQPVTPGEPSHTVLLTNLANHVQPILRYDLGDAVLARPDPCPCRNPGPAVRVQGRAADLLTFPRPDPAREQTPITLAPLPLATLLEAIPGLELFQIVQTAPTTLRIRLHPAPDADPDTLWHQVETRMRDLLAGHGLGHITIKHASEPPQQNTGGKYRTVIPAATPTDRSAADTP
ncbi:Phenylacetate-coenzyme A ligase PaaK, adenylate-forming domain family [Micromonospora viridifaciens]|uniref:Phenylacetate-coenzyme A ligase PaaK, adenylate-forming domain family n=1 Tax=Micromonospora viridifaciens TaxID=1881 RepID=A0A1C4WM32_MICVI|nr:phenylacetate--CoA ligase family protein [Micromonospora viridifaciens]SCE97280.1 Phenylacetate-coenzyme A ligase PaaK, adenylate-forming domain family [Micromonospora viridifaciens]